MVKFDGRLKTKRQAVRLAERLEAQGLKDAARYLRIDWTRVAARPAIVERLYSDVEILESLS